MQTVLPPDIDDKPHLRRLISAANHVICSELRAGDTSSAVEWSVATERRAVRLAVRVSADNSAPCEVRFPIGDLQGDMSRLRSRVRRFCRSGAGQPD